MLSLLDSFMDAVLGSDASNALAKAAQRSATIANIIGPRTIVGWSNLASRWSYDGTVPGLEDSVLRFEKTENGLTGIMSIGDVQLDFEDAQPENLSAMLCVGLKCSPDLSKSEGATVKAMGQLGETVDLMIKVRAVTLLKTEPKCNCKKCTEAKCKCHCHDVEKTELPSKMAAPKPPDEPVGAMAPVATTPRRTAIKKPVAGMIKSLDLNDRHMGTKCSVCDSTSFRDGEFRACFCLRELAPFVKSEYIDNGVRLTFGDEWSAHARILLKDILHVDVI